MAVWSKQPVQVFNSPGLRFALTGAAPILVEGDPGLMAEAARSATAPAEPEPALPATGSLASALFWPLVWLASVGLGGSGLNLVLATLPAGSPLRHRIEHEWLALSPIAIVLMVPVMTLFARRRDRRLARPDRQPAWTIAELTERRLVLKPAGRRGWVQRGWTHS